MYVDNNVLWNGKALALRAESMYNTLDKGINTINYDEFPIFLKSRSPIQGTLGWARHADNQLDLKRSTFVYMMRSDEWGSWGKMMDLGGWEATGMIGNFVSHYTVEIYKRFFKPGKYQLDDKSALYFFVNGKVQCRNR